MCEIACASEPRRPCCHWDVFSHIDRARAYAPAPHNHPPLPLSLTSPTLLLPTAFAHLLDSFRAMGLLDTQNLNQRPISPLATPFIWSPTPSMSLFHLLTPPSFARFASHLSTSLAFCSMNR